jgi:hypothetical protein
MKGHDRSPADVRNGSSRKRCIPPKSILQPLRMTFIRLTGTFQPR